MDVTVIDYGMGNVWSVLSALRYLGANGRLSSAADEIVAAPTLILPGVGSFRRAMEALRERKIESAIHEAVHTRGARILGICLGMQLLGSAGSEDGETRGLGLIANRVDHFAAADVGANKVPHVGFNRVQFTAPGRFFRDLSDSADFYFVHSYRMLAEQLTGELGHCAYGTSFLAALHTGNIYGAQFHPEKSQTNGLVLLRNFLDP